ncbi:hypothetical protein R1flu_026686 [Riccia fluitans]|uniref:Uncharacterized protein n=1 Tax=Riccia fluitans TaxID=41844 RepID=A0ABD1XKP5_9MARC
MMKERRTETDVNAQHGKGQTDVADVRGKRITRKYAEVERWLADVQCRVRKERRAKTRETKKSLTGVRGIEATEGSSCSVEFLAALETRSCRSTPGNATLFTGGLFLQSRPIGCLSEDRAAGKNYPEALTHIYIESILTLATASIALRRHAVRTRLTGSLSKLIELNVVGCEESLSLPESFGLRMFTGDGVSFLHVRTILNV